MTNSSDLVACEEEQAQQTFPFFKQIFNFNFQTRMIKIQSSHQPSQRCPEDHNTQRRKEEKKKKKKRNCTNIQP